MKKIAGRLKQILRFKNIGSLKSLSYSAVMFGMVASLVVTMVPQEVMAVTNQYITNKNQGNEVERAYVNDGYGAGVWISSPNSAYANTGIDVREGQKTVDVVVRGSWSPKSRPALKNDRNITGVYANLKTDGRYPVTGGGYSRGDRLLTLNSGKIFYRGDKPRSNYDGIWYARNTDTSRSGSEGGQVRARLDVSKFCAGNYGKTITKNVMVASILTYKLRTGGRQEIGTYNYDRTPVNVRCIATSWNLSGTTDIDRTTATVGQAVRWQHRVKNNGPANMNRNASVSVQRVYRDSAGHQIGSPVTRSISTNARGNKGATIASDNPSYTMTASDVNRSVCERVAWNPRSSSKSGWGYSSWKCATVPPQYEIYPNASINATIAQPGDSVDLLGNVYNQGNMDRNVQWGVSRVIIKRGQLKSFNDNFNRTMASSPNWKYGQTTKTGTDLGTCDWLNISPGGSKCDDLSNSGTVNAKRSIETQAVSSSVSIPNDASYGDLVCFVLATRSVSSKTKDARRYGGTTCVVISKQPKVQVWGGDLRVGKSIRASQSTVGGKVFGSWGEYGVFSTDKNATMGSAGSLQGGASASSSTDRLTFANRRNGATISGEFGQVAHVGLRNQFMGDGALGLSSRGEVPNGSSRSVNSMSSGIYEASGIIKLSGQLSSGKTIIMRPARNGDGSLKPFTVEINKNITIAGGSMTSLNDIPQLIIIADNINIDEDVSQVNAWLLTNGAINTCYNGKDILTIDICKRKLTINGPVETENIKLRRTAGSETNNDQARSNPAEVFNLRSESSLWLYSKSSNTGVPTTTNIRELPPRF